MLEKKVRCDGRRGRKRKGSRGPIFRGRTVLTSYGRERVFVQNIDTDGSASGAAAVGTDDERCVGMQYGIFATCDNDGAL